MPVKVGDDRQLQAAVLAFKAADRDLRRRINASTRATFNIPWRTGIQARARTRLERRALVPGARIAAGNPPTFIAASSRRRLSGGLIPDTEGAPFEFGAADTEKVTEYQRRSPSGGTHKVRRHTRRQLPAQREDGPVMGTLAEMAPRAASLWTQLIMRVYFDAAEGK